MLRRIFRAYFYVFHRYPSIIGMGLIVIIVQFGWSAVMAIVPLYFKNHFHQESMIGLVLLAFLGTETLLKPPLGEIGDRIGRKPVLMGGGIAAIIAMGLLHLVNNWIWFIPLMGLNGVAAAAIWPAVSAYMGERVPAEDKASAMSIFEGGYLIGFGAGGAAGLYLGGVYGNENIFLIAACAFVLAMLLVTAIVKEGVFHPTTDTPVETGEHSLLPVPLKSGLSLLHEAPMLSRLMIVYLISQFATTALAPIVTLYGEQELGRTQEEMAELFILPTVVVAMIGVALGRLADKMGKSRAVISCYTIAALCLGLLYFARAPEAGVVMRVTPARNDAGTEVHVSRRRTNDLSRGDELSVRREGMEIARVQIVRIHRKGFVAKLLYEGEISPHDRVFVHARPWQIAFLVIGLALLLIAYALGAPALLGLASAVAPPEKQGQALGLMNAAQGVGSCIGILTGPFIYKHISPQSPVIMACATYIFCVVFASLFIRESPAPDRMIVEIPERETASIGSGQRDDE